MTDAINGLPKADVIPNGYLLENPAENFADAIKAANGQAPVWTQQQKQGMLHSFSRTVGDFTVNVDVDLKGAARVEIDGPTVGRPIAITDFDQASLQAAVAGVPTKWVQPLVNAAVATAAPPQGVDAAVAHAQSRIDGLRNWITHIGRQPEAAKSSPADDLKNVRTISDALRETLDGLKTAPEGLRAEAEKLRKTIGQATFAAETNDSLLGVMLTRTEDFKILNTAITNVVTQNQVNAAAGTLAPQLSALNQQIVNMVKTTSGGSLIKDLARAAAATGAGASAAIAAAKVQAEAVQHGPIAQLIELRAPQTGAASPTWVESLQKNNDDMVNVQQFVGGLGLYMRQQMCWGLFADPAQGPDAIQLYADRIKWRDVKDDRDLEPKDLQGVTKDQVNAAIADTNARISNGLRTFMKQSPTVNDRELAIGFLDVARGQKLPYADLVQAMAAAGIELPPPVELQASNATADTKAVEEGAKAIMNLDSIAANNQDIAAFRTFLQGLSVLTAQPMRWQVFQEEPASPQGLYIKDTGFVWDPDGQSERAVQGDEAMNLNLEHMQDVLEELVERVFNGVKAFFGEGTENLSQQELANALCNQANRADADHAKDLEDLLKALGDAGVPV